MLFLSKCAKKLDEGLDFPNSCFKGVFLCLNHHFFNLLEHTLTSSSIK